MSDAARTTAKRPLTRLQRAREVIERAVKAGRKVPSGVHKIDFESTEMTPAQNARAKSLEPVARECLARGKKAAA